MVAVVDCRARCTFELFAWWNELYLGRNNHRMWSHRNRERGGWSPNRLSTDFPQALEIRKPIEVRVFSKRMWHGSDVVDGRFAAAFHVLDETSDEHLARSGLPTWTDGAQGLFGNGEKTHQNWSLAAEFLFPDSVMWEFTVFARSAISRAKSRVI